MQFQLRQLKGLVIGSIFLSAGALAQPLTYSQYLCKQKGYQCYTVRYYQSWSTLWPNESERDMMQRLNRMNIRLRPGMVLAVPINRNLTTLEIAPLANSINSDGTRTVVVSLKSLAWGAYSESGQLIKWGPISGGRDFCSDTNASCLTKTGVFTIYRKGDADCYSSKFPLGQGGAPMPYCMFYSGGYALHGSPFGLPGYNDSHGCVRMFPEDAEWLNAEFSNGEKVKVIVTA